MISISVSVMFFCCCCSQPLLKINDNSFTIDKLLGEGGFSYVYLVHSKDSSKYALKKIRCGLGIESKDKLKIAIKEVQNYKEFKSPFIIHSIDDAIIQDVDGSKIFYILLPYFENGSLQDLINSNDLDNTIIEESEAIRIFIGICRGLQVMHKHSSISTVEEDNLSENDQLLNETESLIESVTLGDDEEFELNNLVSFAHRDIKPANIMISKDGLPVLCDLGSCSRAKIRVKTKQQALKLQEFFAENCTLPYRAPELLNVENNVVLDEKCDIWSLGCTLYALLFNCSPFEYEEIKNGGNMNLAIASGRFEFPSNKKDLYSDEIKQLIQSCLTLDFNNRPSIDEILQLALTIQSNL